MMLIGSSQDLHIGKDQKHEYPQCLTADDLRILTFRHRRINRQPARLPSHNGNRSGAYSPGIRNRTAREERLPYR